MKEITEEEAREFIAKQAGWTEHPHGGYYASYGSAQCWFDNYPEYFDDEDREALFWMREAILTITEKVAQADFASRLIEVINREKDGEFRFIGASPFHIASAGSATLAKAFLNFHGYKLKETK